MKNLIITMIVLFMSSSSWSKGVNEGDFKNLSFNKMQSARWAYIKFMMKVEKIYVMDADQEKYSVNNQIPEFFKSLEKSYAAYAATQDGDVCFFGGWPSKLENNICKGPWNYQNDPEILKYGDSYNGQNTCGGNYFRCNPTLFGAPSANSKSPIAGIDINLSPKNGAGKGYCVESSGGYKELTQKCEQVSRDSIPNIVNGLKADTPEGQAKRNQMAGLHDSIFGKDGKSGFCGNFKSNSGEVYDACDDLRKRLNDLGLTGNKNENVKKGIGAKDKALTASGNNYSKSIEIMNACQQYMNDEDIEDPFRRNFVGKMNGGLKACSINENDGAAVTLSSSELDQVSDSFDKMGYLGTLNKETFKNTIKAIMVNELSFVESNPQLSDEKMNVTDKGQFLLNIADKFPDIKKDGYMDMFNEAYDEVITHKDKIQAQDYEKVQPQFKAVSDVVNNSCAQINFEYQKKFGKDKWFTGNFIRTKSPAEQQWLATNKRELNHKIRATFTQTKLSPFLATEHFQDKVMDPEDDFFENCLDEPNHFVINPYIQPEDFNIAVTQLRDRLFDSFDDLDEGKFLGISSDFGLNHDIDDYIKSDPNLILSTILKAKDSDQVELSKYLCSRFSSIQKWDDRKDILNDIAVYGGGASFLLCLVPTGVTQLIFCPAAKALLGTAAVGGIEKFGDGLSQEYANERAITRGGVRAGTFIQNEKLAEDRSEDGMVQTALSALSFVHVEAKIVNLGKGKGLKKYNNGWEDYIGPWPTKSVPKSTSGSGVYPALGNMADDALPHGQKLLTGPPSLPGPVGNATNTGNVAQLGDASVKTGNTVIQLGDKTGNTAIQLADKTGNTAIQLADKTGNTVIQLGDATAKTTTGVKKGFELSTNVLPRTVANNQSAKIINAKDLNLSSKDWKLLRETHMNPASGSTLPKVEKIKFFGENGKVTERGREVFISIKNLATSPSAQFSDEFLADATRIINSGNAKHIRKIQDMVRERLKALFQVNGELTNTGAVTKISEFQTKIGLGKHPKGSEIESVARDEAKRLVEAYRIISKK